MIAKKIAGPANGTVAHEALKELLAAGGSLASSALERVLPARYRSSSRFTQIVVDPLAVRSLAYEVNGIMEITAKGRKFLKQEERADQPEPETSGNIASCRSIPTFKPLDISKIMAGGPIRPGMNDYASIPSMAGTTRRPYRGNRE